MATKTMDFGDFLIFIIFNVIVLFSVFFSVMLTPMRLRINVSFRLMPILSICMYI